MKAEPGAELACRARNYRFEHQGNPQERGVISYLCGANVSASHDVCRLVAAHRGSVQRGSPRGAPLVVLPTLPAAAGPCHDPTPWRAHQGGGRTALVLQLEAKGVGVDLASVLGKPVQWGRRAGPASLTWAAPNNRLQPTPSSLCCAPASGRG
jgi:hypothetical protein